MGGLFWVILGVFYFVKWIYINISWIVMKNLILIYKKARFVVAEFNDWWMEFVRDRVVSSCVIASDPCCRSMSFWFVLWAVVNRTTQWHRCKLSPCPLVHFTKKRISYFFLQKSKLLFKVNDLYLVVYMFCISNCNKLSPRLTLKFKKDKISPSRIITIINQLNNWTTQC